MRVFFQLQRSDLNRLPIRKRSPCKMGCILGRFLFWNSAENSKLMNLSSFRTFLAFICSIGLISYVVAGPGQSGDHGRGSSSGPGFNQDNNPGQQGQSASDGTKFNSQDNPGKSGSAFGRETAEDGSSNEGSHQNSNAFDRG